MMSTFDKITFDEIPTQDEMFTALMTKARARTVDTGMNRYGLEIRRSVRSLWKSYTSVDNFIHIMSLAIRSGFTKAWEDGIATCGFKMADMTLLERARLQLEIASEINYVSNFANAIREGDQISGGKLGPLVERSQMWSLRYAYIYDLARTHACGDQKLEWRINVTRHVKESCDDCLLLNGKVYRASEWRAHDVSPKMHRLKCGGFRCGCGFIATTKPVSTAPFPII